MKTALVLLALLAAPAAARAQSLELSSDTTSNLGGIAIDPRQVVEDDGATIVATALGPSAPGLALPDGANLTAFERLPTGEVVFSTDVTVAIAGLAAPGVAGPSDVVRVDDQGPAVVFSGAQAGLPGGVAVDALEIESDGDLLLSFDTSVEIGGVAVDDEDVVRLDLASGTASIVYDGSAQGVSADLDLDAVSRRLGDGHLLVSFDGSGSVGSVRFDDEDVLDWDPASDVYVLAYDGSAARAAWPAGADLDAVSGVPAPCENGLDDDGDGLVDYPADPACKSASWASEDAACQNGVDDDRDGYIDFDGGASSNGGIAITTPDRACSKAWGSSETASSRCGLGAEVALALALVRLGAKRVRRARRDRAEPV